MSPNVAVRTDKYSEAVEFYTTVLGFNNRSTDPDLADLEADPLNIFVIEDQEISGPVMELFVDDLVVFSANRGNKLTNLTPSPFLRNSPSPLRRRRGEGVGGRGEVYL